MRASVRNQYVCPCCIYTLANVAHESDAYGLMRTANSYFAQADTICVVKTLLLRPHARIIIIHRAACRALLLIRIIRCDLDEEITRERERETPRSTGSRSIRLTSPILTQRDSRFLFFFSLLKDIPLRLARCCK